MKQITSLILAAALGISLCACGGQSAEAPQSASAPVSAADAAAPETAERSGSRTGA